jgi:hypothetical protein
MPRNPKAKKAIRPLPRTAIFTLTLVLILSGVVIAPFSPIKPDLRASDGYVWTKAEVKRWTKILWHTSKAEWKCLDDLNMQESKWDYQAEGDKTTLGRAYGVAQALPASKYEYISKDWRTNPMTQVVWQKKYIELRYFGKPCLALRHELKRGWY